MSGILLGALAYSGLNNSINNLNNIQKTNIQYNTNIKNSIKYIEKNQAKQDFTRPEYLNQFDDLRFDNIGNPAGENDTYKTVLGQNASLKRDLMMRDNYSFFDNTQDGTYNVVRPDQFMHNNMMPNTTQRDVSKSNDMSQRRMETFTGSTNNLILKTEKVPLFEPMKDLSWVNGAPAITKLIPNIEQRYLASNKNNNGNLPFETKVRVAPGLGDKVQEGRYSVYRVNAPSIDQLRSDINQKVTYENKPLEAIKKGELRAPDFNITKYKLPDYREQKIEDFVPNLAAVNAQKQDGIYTNMNTERGDKVFYQPGPSNMTSMGDGPDIGKTMFQPAKKESYQADYTHNVIDVNNKPVFTNIKSWNNCDNQRSSVNTNYKGPIQNATTTYSLDYNDKARQTIKQTTSHDIVSNLAAANFNSQYVMNNDKARTTIKEGTSHDIVTNIAPSTANSQYVNNNDKAKQTIRQTTSHDIVSNLANVNSNSQYVMNNDKAKQTIKQTTSHDIVSNFANVNLNPQYVMNNDKARPTIKEGTSHGIVGNFVPATANSQYTMNNDKARPTIKEGTTHGIISNFVSAHGNSQYVMNNDKARPTIKEGSSHGIVTNIAPATANSQYTMNNDKARPTIKQTTSHGIVSNLVSAHGNSQYTMNNDKARPTIKEGTILSAHPEGNFFNAITGTVYYAKDMNDKARPTMKENTIHTAHIGTATGQLDKATYTHLEDTMRTTTKQSTLSAQPISNVYLSTNVNYSRNPQDRTRDTIKQTTINNTYIGNIRSEVENLISHEFMPNVHQNLCREATVYNRPANGKGDKHGPYFNNETFKSNEPLLYSYTGNAHKPLDHALMPTLSNENIININTVKTRSKPIIDMSSYYINNNFINTLENNPLVNDIYHQKNI